MTISFDPKVIEYNAQRLASVRLAAAKNAGTPEAYEQACNEAGAHAGELSKNFLAAKDGKGFSIDIDGEKLAEGAIKNSKAIASTLGGGIGAILGFLTGQIGDFAGDIIKFVVKAFKVVVAAWKDPKGFMASIGDHWQEQTQRDKLKELAPKLGYTDPDKFIAEMTKPIPTTPEKFDFTPDEATKNTIFENMIAGQAKAEAAAVEQEAKKQAIKDNTFMKMTLERFDADKDGKLDGTDVKISDLTATIKNDPKLRAEVHSAIDKNGNGIDAKESGEVSLADIKAAPLFSTALKNLSTPAK